MKKTTKIRVGGKEYPCRVTMGAMVRFKRESGRDAGELRQGDAADLALFLWCCAASACHADGTEFPYGFEDFEDLLEPSGLAEFYEGFPSAEKKNGGGAVAGIDELVGIATGRIGMGLDDFMRCTPSEFRAAWDAWSAAEERRERGAWERARMSCLCSLQPWSRRKLSARDVMEFPWERDAGEGKGGKPESRGETLARYKAAKARAGLE